MSDNFRITMFLMQMVMLAGSVFVIFKSRQYTARTRKHSEEIKQSLAAIQTANEQLQSMMEGTCCKCKLPKGLVCNDCLPATEDPNKNKYRSIDEPWEKK